jgi:hypothetical protein
MQAVYRRVEVDDAGKVSVDYLSTGPNDYVFAEGFDMMAREVLAARLGIEALKQEQYTTLDQQLEYERSRVARPDETGYSTGFRSDGYTAGFDSDDLDPSEGFYD